MITYENTLFGFSLIFRVHGSALMKASLPSLFSTSLLLAYIKLTDDSLADVDNDHRIAGDHPYTIAGYIAFFSFLLTFRLNYAYQRYWEAATAVHLMMSKWLDAATYLAAFHYQSNQFDAFRPPALGVEKHSRLRNMTRERERERELTREETEEQIRQSQEQAEEEASRNRRWWRKFVRMRNRGRNSHSIRIELKKNLNGDNRNAKSFTPSERRHASHDSTRIPIPRTFQEQFALKNSSHHSPKKGSSIRLSEGQNFNAPRHTPGPSLFLQELVHLLSLLSGVAMSTLRSDIEGADSPLVEYFPGQPMPPVNPDELSPELKGSFDFGSPIMSGIYFLLGLSRGDRYRALYNAARPFPVLGNISDREAELLVNAHGGSAKVSMVSMWLTELYSREYLHGSTGKVPGPIISRVTQVLSDGMVGFNQARKITYVPFPFPHAQMTAFFTIAVLFIFPVLYQSFVNNLLFACVMNFVTVLCFLGIHEVARELENPMENVPNDIPLTTFQAQFNEALVAMYAGFHPDAWWEGEEETVEKDTSGDEDGKETKKEA